ncbi:MAG: AAA family ATPase [Roseburia sp.]|nr:AAA family ATPase [Anaeroplasma bactoclasticum]MCM1196407.1 AAA family ATPase [Roseburia sp.]MCM1556335.1 AAA family ATPase [Anaeroplasma bactoclasticum]
MKLILIFGDSAVGKMTVGQELCKITDLRLFHNHMSIEMVLEVFGSFHQEAILKLRNVIFEEFAKTDNYGLVFTFMWAFEEQEDWKIVKGITDIFEQQNAEIYYVELDASLEVRLERNKTENRLKNKASKRNIELSESYLMKDYKKHRCISYENELPFKNFIRIDNTNLEPNVVAQMIKGKFSL